MRRLASKRMHDVCPGVYSVLDSKCSYSVRMMEKYFKNILLFIHILRIILVLYLLISYFSFDSRQCTTLLRTELMTNRYLPSPVRKLFLFSDTGHSANFTSYTDPYCLRRLTSNSFQFFIFLSKLCVLCFSRDPL